MELRSMGAIIKAAIIASLLASILVAGFHFVVTEPVIDRAIQLEELLSSAEGHAADDALIGRDVQKAGLFLGFLMYGLTWALLFGAIYYLAQRFLLMSASRRGLLLGLLTGWSVSLFPFLKYPANPPGVGDPETIQYRQVLYLTFIALSIASTFLTGALHRHLSRPELARRNELAKRAKVLAVYLAVAVAVYIALPANPDPIRMPADLVWSFRALSLGGLALFWVLFAATFALVIRVMGPARTRDRVAQAPVYRGLR